MKLFLASLGSDSGGRTLFRPSGGDVTTELQEFIDNNVNNEILIGTSRATVYTIDKPLHIPSNSDIQIDAEIKIAASQTQLLTQDLVDGEDKIYVTNADQYFKVGQCIVVSDDDQPTQGGGAWKTRKKGRINWVTGVTSTYIQCLGEFTSQLGIYKVSANAKVGQYNSAIYIYEKTEIKISGSGLINGNWDNQYGNGVVGDFWYGGLEGMDGGCGITHRGSTFIDVSGLEIIDCVLHSIAIFYGEVHTTVNYNCSFSDLVLDACGEKHIAMIGFKQSTLTNIINKNGRDEGEIALYTNNDDIILTNITSINNRRYGVSIIAEDQMNIELYDITVIDNEVIGLYIYNANNTNIKIDGVVGGSPTVKGSGIVSINNCINPTLINNIVINEGFKTASLIGITDSDNLDLTNVSVLDSDDGSTTTIGINIVRSSNVNITGYTIDAVDTCYKDNVDNSNIIFTNGIIDNYTTRLSNNQGNFTFINETDNQNP